MNHQCSFGTGSGGQGGGGQGGSAAGGSSGTSDGGASCGDLATEYAHALAAAQSCDVTASGQCESPVSSSLSPCFSNCLTYVNDPSTLNGIKAIWEQAGCNNVAVLCPAIACLQPAAGVCVAADGGAGVCSSRSIVTTN